jgi:delta11-fatty-acid desaturase
LILFLISLTQIHGFAKGDWFSLVTMPLTWWMFGVNVFHDASHFSLSKNPMINKIGTEFGFMFTTPYVWYHQHIISHHSFPNIMGKDPDLYHSVPVLRHSEDIKYRKAYKH